jgi:hypothetical protein
LDGLEVALPGGDTLSVVFERVADRYQHAILHGGQPLLRSVEGDAHEAWPPSPPLQSLSLETLPDGRRVALLVGMAGRGHWSASVEADEAAGAIVFDIACRVPKCEGNLDSRYAVLANVNREMRVVSSTELGIALGQTTLVISGHPEGEAASELVRENGELVIRCKAATGAAAGGTHRWRYRIAAGRE